MVGSTTGLAAAQGHDVEGSKDHPLISRYPGSWIIGYAAKDYDEYLFPLGKVEDDKPKKSERLEGARAPARGRRRSDRAGGCE